MDKVQCIFLPDTYLPEKPNDTINGEQMIHVKEGVTTLLCIVFKPHHFAVVKVHLKDQRVSVWDSAIDHKALECAEILWLEHIVYLICVHFPDKVRYNKDNMPTNIQTATGSTQKSGRIFGR